MSDIAFVQDLARRLRESVAQVIVGKDSTVDQLLVALFCEGHVLLEDVPGIGKTMLAKTLSASLGISFQRIQFTPDLLPSDIVGVSVYNRKTDDFEYRPGPILGRHSPRGRNQPRRPPHTERHAGSHGRTPRYR